MSDIQQVKTSSDSIISGRGILNGIVASVTSADTQATLTAYDSTTASGTIIFQMEVYSGESPFVLFFPDRFAPRFDTGLYLALDAGLAVVVWASER
jgi:hypothetical protein